MREPDIFKFDIRVRERLLKSGRVTIEELKKQIEALPDIEDEGVELGLEQPAVGRTDGAALNRPSVAPPTLSTADRDPEASPGSLP